MSWFIFLGAAVGVRENYHLGFDVLLYVLPEGSKKILRTISDVVVLAFAIGMVVYGIELMRLQWAERMPALGISGACALPAARRRRRADRALLRSSASCCDGPAIDVDKDLHDSDEVPSIAEVKEVREV